MYWPCSWPLPAISDDVSLGGAADGHADRRGAIGLDDHVRPVPGGTDSVPASISPRIASGSSERGLSLVKIATSASSAAAAPISGRLAGVPVAAAAEHDPQAALR